MVDARRDDLDAVGGRAVQLLQLVSLGSGGRQHQIRARDDLVLDTRTELGVVVDPRVRLHAGQGVERGDERKVQLVLQPMADRAGEPVVGVQRVVLNSLVDEIKGGRHHRIHQLDEFVLRDRYRGTGIEVHDAKSGLDGDRIRLVRMLPPNEHIALDAGSGQGRGQRADVDAHAPAITRAGLRERGAMNRKDGETAH